MSMQTKTIETEISEILNSILQKTMQIQQMNLSQKLKDYSKLIMSKSVDLVLDELSPMKLQQITIQQLRKTQFSKK